MTDRAHAALLDSVNAALEELVAASKQRSGEITEPLKRTHEFVQFKAYATVDLAEHIRRQLEAGTSSVSPVPHSGSIEVTIDHAARFGLFLLVDAFLFEAASVRDALAQLANVAFELGIPVDDPQLVNRVKNGLKVNSESNTGLESWLERSRQPRWLEWLIELRNITTHRHVMRLPEQLRCTDKGNGSVWGSEINIERETNEYEPLEDFVARTKRDLSALLADSLRQLAQFKSQPR